MHRRSKLSIHYFFISTISFFCLSTGNDLTVFAQEQTESSFKKNADAIFNFICAKTGLTENDRKSLRKIHLAATEYEQSRLENLDEIALQANFLAEGERLMLMLIQVDCPDEIDLEVNILAESARLDLMLFEDKLLNG